VTRREGQFTTMYTIYVMIYHITRTTLNIKMFTFLSHFITEIVKQTIKIYSFISI